MLLYCYNETFRCCFIGQTNVYFLSDDDSTAQNTQNKLKFSKTAPISSKKIKSHSNENILSNDDSTSMKNQNKLKLSKSAPIRSMKILKPCELVDQDIQSSNNSKD